MKPRRPCEDREFFYKEYKVAKRCAMRNICKMVSFFDVPSPNPDKVYFILMEYCDRGSLKDCIDKHKISVYVQSFADVIERVMMSWFLFTDCSIIDRDPIPEEFLWHVFLSLARALRMMHFGTPPGQEPPESWQPYLHCDIKPDNGQFIVMVELVYHSVWPLTVK